MAQSVSVIISDDLDGPADAEAVMFTFSGQGYEIDLSEKNRARLEKSLQPFIEAGRRTASRRVAKSARARRIGDRPGSGARLGRRPGPEGLRAGPNQRRGNDQLRGRPLSLQGRAVRDAVMQAAPGETAF
jgi:hypothetical protein